jgi:hypothetical protein
MIARRYLKHTVLIILFFALVGIDVFAQNTGYPEGWGMWKTRILLTAKNLGPNALPVPEIRSGLLSEEAYLNLSGFFHQADYDHTYCPFFKISLPFAQGRVALEVWSPFLEYYNVDSLSLVERKAWNTNPSGYSAGDVYIATLIQVLKGHQYLPDILLSINLKTASGSMLESLRHTDTPGYYFDVSMGREFQISKKIAIKPYGLIGFYVYQTLQVMNLQNDALLWGAGMDIASSKIEVKLNAGGYHGYFNQGDRPIVARLQCRYQLGESLAWVAGFQHGLNDFNFTSFHTGLKINFMDMFKKAVE